MSAAPKSPTTAGYGVWPWIELLRRHQVDLAKLCMHAGLKTTEVREPFTRWPQPVCNRVAEYAYQHVGPDAAMAAACTVEAGHFQLLELLVRTTATVADGLRIGCFLFPLLHSGGRFVHERLRSGDHAITWVPPAGCVVHHGYVELTFGVTMLGIRRETKVSGARARAISLRREHDGPFDAYEHVLGRAPQFGATEDRLILDARTARLRMTRRNAELHRRGRALAEELLDDGQA